MENVEQYKIIRFIAGLGLAGELGAGQGLGAADGGRRARAGVLNASVL